jgi:hypothetical protein
VNEHMIVHDGESISSRVYEVLRTFQVGKEFTASEIAKQLNLVGRTGGVSGFLSLNTHKGMYEIVGTSGKSIVFKMRDPTVKLSFYVRGGPGGKVGRQLGGQQRVNYQEAKQKSQLTGFQRIFTRSAKIPTSPRIVDTALPQPTSQPILSQSKLSQPKLSLVDRLVDFAVEIEALRTTLAQFTTEELLAELKRRSAEKRI